MIDTLFSSCHSLNNPVMSLNYIHRTVATLFVSLETIKYSCSCKCVNKLDRHHYIMPPNRFQLNMLKTELNIDLCDGVNVSYFITSCCRIVTYMYKSTWYRFVRYVMKFKKLFLLWRRCSMTQ